MCQCQEAIALLTDVLSPLQMVVTCLSCAVRQERLVYVGENTLHGKYPAAELSNNTIGGAVAKARSHHSEQLLLIASQYQFAGDDRNHFGQIVVADWKLWTQAVGLKYLVLKQVLEDTPYRVPWGIVGRHHDLLSVESCKSSLIYRLTLRAEMESCRSRRVNQRP